MDKRKELILNTIIKEHIKTGMPVGSGVLVEKYKLDISPATARNEMAALENEGYIMQPHTSAGRVPTEEAYIYFIENLKEKKLRENEEKILKHNLRNCEEADLKETAKAIAEITKSAVFWAFHKNNLYYTGFSNLFQQPEFSQLDLIYDISTIIDRFDEIVDEIFEEVENNESILIGSKNPFGNFCGTVMIKYRKGNNIGLFGILGPMRMDYEKNLAIIKFVNNKINNL